MKKVLLIILFIVLLIPVTAYAQEEDNEEGFNTQEMVDQILEQVDTYDLEKIIGDINSDIREYLPELSLKNMIASLAKGEFSINIKEFFIGVSKYLFHELISNSGLLATLILLSLICAILQNLQKSFDNNAVGEIAFNVVYLVIIGIAIQSFATAMQVGKEAVESMVTFMHALLPTLILLLASMGSLASAALFQPIVTVAVTMLSTFIKNIILPILFFATILNLVNYISEKIQISKLVGLLKQVALVLLGFVLTIFIGVMTIQGVSASSFDGVSVRTAKYAVDNLLPIVGGFLSDAVDTIIGCSLLIKNAIGAVGLIFLFLMILFPIIKIIGLVLIYKISSAVVEPIVDSRIVNCLNDMAKSLLLIFASVIAVAIMFFIAITIIVAAGNATVMMR